MLVKLTTSGLRAIPTQTQARLGLLQTLLKLQLDHYHDLIYDIDGPKSSKL